MSGDSTNASMKDTPPNLPAIATSRLVGHDEGPIRMVKFTSDGKYCLTAGHDRTVRLWNPLRIDPAHQHYRNKQHDSSNTQGKESSLDLDSLPPALPIQTYSDGHNHPVSAIDMDDLSTTLVSASEKTLVVTDILTQKLKKRFQGHVGRINSVACSKGGSIFLSASYDGTVRIWDGRSFSKDPVQVLKDASDSVSCVKILENSERDVHQIMTCSVDGCLRTYDVRRGWMNTDDYGRGDMSLICFANTSDDLCTAVSCLNGSIHVVEKSTGTLLGTCFGGHVAGRYSLECNITSDDEYIVSGSEDGRVVFYDLKTGLVVQSLEGHERVTTTVACHPKVEHSSVVISGSYDGNAIVWTNGNSFYLDALRS
mmetsp:Transcript_11686/g.21850  ORF Transcript_11686/g.21850 Transcript_11686/m.21850 type:complete len:368 (+) Transcript_11686:147-1250(+)